MKIVVFFKLAETTKLAEEYVVSNRFLKKALEYIWIVNDVEKEIFVYDKLGENYFQLGNLEKAQYFHQRSVNS